MRAFLRVPLAAAIALLLVSVGATLTRQLAGGAVSVALAVPVLAWLGMETSLVEGVVGAAVVGVILDSAAGGPSGLLTFLSVMLTVGVRVGSGPFDARSALGFGLLSAVTTFLMGLGAIVLLRYVSSEAAAPGYALLGRVAVEAVLTGLAAPGIRWLLDRLLVPAGREQAGVLR